MIIVHGEINWTLGITLLRMVPSVIIVDTIGRLLSSIDCWVFIVSDRYSYKDKNIMRILQP